MQTPQRLPPLRVLAVLRPADQTLLGGLATNQCVVVSTGVETLDRSVGLERSNAVVIDAEMQGAFEAVQRLRKVGGLAGIVPVAFVGGAEVALVVGEFLQRHGPGVFAQRPVAGADLAARLRVLHDTNTQQHRASASLAGSSPTPRNSPAGGVSRVPQATMPRRPTPQPFAPPAASQPISPLRAATPAPGSLFRAPTPIAGATVAPAVPSAISPSGVAVAGATVSAQALAESPLAQASSPALRPGAVSATVWNPPSLAAPLTTLLRSALSDAGGSAEDFELPPPGNDDLDDLVPPELLEPLDAPFEALAEESAEPSRFTAPPTTSPGVQARRNAGSRHANASNVTPLPVDGDLRLAGSLGRYGVATLLAAAARARATGVVFVQARQAQWQVCLHAGHVLAVRGSRPEDLIGPALVRLGYIPQEAARFAEVSLDMGVRGAALLAARGYLSPDGVAPVLARAAQEMLFDLICLESCDWEIRPLESSVGIPMHTRAPEALLVLGARARIEPVVAYGALGGDGTSVTLRAEPSAIASLPLTATERAAALAARDVGLASLVRTHGEPVLPSLLALHWLQHLRVEGPAHDGSAVAPSPERTRLRALLEAARRKDLLAVLGVSPFATRSAGLLALDARRAEVDAIRARNPNAEALALVGGALDELARLLQDVASWERYATALRASSLRDE
jgi:hypothetical protein